MGRQMDIRGRWYLVLLLMLCCSVFAQDAHNQQIHNVLDPDENQDAATKKYVDDNISGPGGIHNLRSSAHGDTTNGTPPANGSFIIGNGTLWDERTPAQAMATLSGEATAAFSLNDQALIAVGYLQIDTEAAFSGGAEGDVWWKNVDHGLNHDY